MKESERTRQHHHEIQNQGSKGSILMDYTIEVWTNLDLHYAECSCGWELTHRFQHMMEIHVKNHIQTHKELGEIVEVV